MVKRRKARSNFAADAPERSFFDAQRTEVVNIEVPNEAVAGLSPDPYKVVGVKTSRRLAQRPGSYMVQEYRRSVIKWHAALPAGRARRSGRQPRGYQLRGRACGWTSSAGACRCTASTSGCWPPASS